MKRVALIKRITAWVALSMLFISTLAGAIAEPSKPITLYDRYEVGTEETAHVHDELCYDELGQIICTEGGDEQGEDAPSDGEEAVADCGLIEHAHAEACYDEAGALVCGLEEHGHSEACYAEQSAGDEPLCGSAEHTHTSDCYDEAGALVCGLEEHGHSEACYAEQLAEDEPLCGFDEHTHTPDCYDETGEPACGLEEHVHDELCYVEVALMALSGESAELASGTLSNGIQWRVTQEGEDVVLTLSGAGEVPNYGLTAPPWKTEYTGYSGITRVVVESGITRIGNNTFSNLPNLFSVELPDGLTRIGDSAFSYCSALWAVDLPESLSMIEYGAFSGCTRLREVTIPKAVTSIGQDAFSACSGIETIVYNAANCVPSDSSNRFGVKPGCNVVIGDTVNRLNLGSLFSSIMSNGGRIAFEGNSSYEILFAQGTMPAPFDAISGNVHTDQYGVVYDENNVLLYCPAGIEAYEVPAACTGIGPYAFNLATNLKTLTFAEPMSITSIPDYAFSGCLSLESIAGMTTIVDAVEHFETLVDELGEYAFYNCGLPYSDEEGMLSDESAIDVNGHGRLRIQINSGTISGGRSELLTGESLSVRITADEPSNSESPYYRIYFQKSGSEGSLTPGVGSHSFGSGEEGGTTTKDIVLECVETEVAGLYYYEFTLEAGQTLDLTNVSLVYPSPTSPGGEWRIWGMILTEEEAEASKGKAKAPGTYLQGVWSILTDNYVVDKTGQQGNTVISLQKDDSKDGVNLNPTSLEYTIKSYLEGEPANASTGKNPVISADYADVLVLPEGVSWDEEVLAAIEAGNWTVNSSGSIFVKLNGEPVQLASFRLSSTTDHALNANKIKLEVVNDAEGERQVRVAWTLDSRNVNNDMALSSVTFTLSNLGRFLSFDFDAYDTASETQVIKNSVDATFHYTHTEDQTDGDDHDVPIKKPEAEVSINKRRTQRAQYFGEPLAYQVTVSNPSVVPYEQVMPDGSLSKLTDPLDQYLHIKPEDMEDMFEADLGKLLKITIRNASIYTGGIQQVTGVDGRTLTTVPQYSTGGAGDSTTTISIAWDEAKENLMLTVGGSTSAINGTIRDALNAAGYAVTTAAAYTVEWSPLQEVIVEGENDEEAVRKFVLNAGETLVFTIPATVKDTFEQMGNVDWPGHSESGSHAFSNAATLTYPTESGETFISGQTSANSQYAEKEAYIDKTVSKNKEQVNEGNGLQNGDVLDYSVTFTHKGTGEYSNLPMVDDISGAQQLLVIKEHNTHLEGMNVEVVEVNGSEFYALKEGVFEGVRVGSDGSGAPLYADTITVVQGTGEKAYSTGGITYKYTGLHTRIKWYFSELSGSFTKNITYKVRINTEYRDEGSATYSVGNIAWMSDKPTKRIFSPTWFNGTILGIEKDIVEIGEDGTEVVNEEDHSGISRGDEVTYKLTLTNKGNAPFRVTGKEMYDALPSTGGQFAWDESNVSLRIEQGADSIECSDLVNEWEIITAHPDTGDEVPGQYYIVWADDSFIQYETRSEVYIYVTLKFPAGEVEFDQYAAAIGGGMLRNTLAVFGFTSSVTHDLNVETKALLQKGVYSAGKTVGGTYYADGSREYYSNDDAYTRTVEYYVVLYNSGSTRLYLDEMTDKLPKGFTFNGLFNCDAPTYMNNSVFRIMQRPVDSLNALGGSVYAENYPLLEVSDSGLPEGVEFVSVSVLSNPNNSDGTVRFTFGEADARAGTAALYDEKERKYYLERGQAIAFGVSLRTNARALTEDVAPNTIAMPYHDYTGMGVSVPNGVTVWATNSATYGAANDGTREVDVAGDQTHLSSTVAVRRGEILPGIAKRTESYTNDSQTYPYVSGASTSSIINWGVTLYNNGTMPIYDYTITETMEKEYGFTGTVKYDLYDNTGTQPSLTAANNYLFTIEREGDTGIKLTGSTTRTNPLADTLSLTIGGDAKRLRVGFYGNSVSIRVRFYLDEAGNEVMELQFDNSTMAIPGGGRGQLSISTANQTNTHIEKAYTNGAVLTPNTQEYEGDYVSIGQNLTDESGNNRGVYSDSLVVVTYGYMTDAYKRVTEKENEENTASSRDTNNAILLSSAEKPFHYELSVSAPREIGITKLVLIDALPEVGDREAFTTDAARRSEFKVRLADDPNFAVAIAGHVLNADQYTVEYSGTTDFTDADWEGEPGQWMTLSAWTSAGHSMADVRSIRVMMQAATANEVLISPTESASVTFEARIQGEAEPGQVAWNSFGYSYVVVGDNRELKSAPRKVGVRVPYVPELTKRLVTASGQTQTAAEDASFTFLIYEGEYLNVDYADASALKVALADKAFTVVDLEVEQGGSFASMSLGGLYKWAYSGDAWAATGDSWLWIQGRNYTVVEVAMAEGYDFYRMYGSTGNHYTFEFEPGARAYVTCYNAAEAWEILLIKRDEQQPEVTLPGAVFALYSPEPEDAMTDEAYQALSDKPEREIEAEGGGTWYLMSVETTDAGGGITWGELKHDSYYVAEVAAPDGYYLSWEARQLNKPENIAQLIIEADNLRGAVLPATGGPGALHTTAGGILVMLLAGLLYIHKARRNGKGGCAAHQS